MSVDPPTFPIGPFESINNSDSRLNHHWLEDISLLPAQLREAVIQLDESQLDTKYRNWTIRQIVHHVADSHVNSYIRFKWALTESSPIIKAYDEGSWSDLNESRTGSIEPSLQLLAGLHSRWRQLLDCMTESQFQLTFVHPETNESHTLLSALAYYAWHGKHHTGQIDWLCENGLV